MRGIVLSLALMGLFAAAGAAADTLFTTNEAVGPAGFRLSGGVSVQGSTVTVNALANGAGTLTLDRVTWSAGGSVPDSRTGIRDLAPYGGVGYSESFAGGFTVNWDAGALIGALPILPRVVLPGLPEDLALQNDYLESHLHAVAAQPMGEVSLSVKF